MSNDEHNWDALFTSPTIKLYTCIRCGLFKLETINSNFYLIRWSDRFSQCTGSSAHDAGMNLTNRD